MQSGATARSEPGRPIPTREEAQALSREFLGDQGTRLAHVLNAGRVAARLGVLFDADTARLLEVAATVHDIGYSPRLRVSGFHPMDGGIYLRAQGYPDVLARLVANHSLAVLHAGPHADELTERFPPVDGLLADALAYSDMHSSPSGELIAAEHRLADITARHADLAHEQRAAALRVVLARVGEALLAAERASAEPGLTGRG